MSDLPDPPFDPDEERIQAAEHADLDDPRNAPQLLHAAELCLAQGDPPRAERLTRQAVSLTPSDPAPHRVLSGILWVEGHAEAAISSGLEAARLAPADGHTRLHLGSLLLAMSAWRQAADHLAICVQHLPENPLGWRLLSSALQEMGRTPRALEAAEHAITHAPATVEYRVHHAALLAACGRYGDAIAALNRAAVLDSKDANVWRGLSAVHAALGEYHPALDLAERAHALDPACESHADHLAHVQRLLGLLDQPSRPAGQGYWTERPTAARRLRAPRPGPLGLAAIQARIVFALMLREMRTRFARSRLGYVWAIVEPASHIATLGSVFSLLNHAPPPVGDHLFEFYLTGLLPFLMFSHVTNEVMTGFAANAPVLQIPLVKRIDVILARALLSLATEILVGILVFSALALFGWQALPADLLTTLAALLALWLMATGIGALNVVLVEFVPAWDNVFAALVRVLYFASGIYYSPIVMPAQIRAWLVYNPILQAVEWFRAGFYAGYQPHWLDRGYVVLWALAALLIGLSAERALRRRMMVAA